MCKEIFCFGATKKGYVSTFASTLSWAYLSLIYLYLEDYTLRLLHAVTIATFQPHSQRSLLPVPKEREFYYPNAMLLSFNGTTGKIHSISVWTEHVKHTTSARAVSLSTRTWIRWNGFFDTKSDSRRCNWCLPTGWRQYCSLLINSHFAKAFFQPHQKATRFMYVAFLAYLSFKLHLLYKRWPMFNPICSMNITDSISVH